MIFLLLKASPLAQAQQSPLLVYVSGLIYCK